ncbi:MAG: hypothetical protein GWP08_10400 [Nitrospiraceae bacterium]|nr:hypothetical protein [Nitrospiraceae bacterium]
MILAVLLASLMHAQPNVDGIDSLPAIEEMPDPFLFQDGRRVETLEDWRERRKEMLELILKYQYGHVPPAPGNVQVDGEPKVLQDDKTLHRTVRITMGPENKLSTTVHVYSPKTGTAPYPVIVRFGIDSRYVRLMNRRGYVYVCFEQVDLDPDTEGHDIVGPAQLAYPEYDWASLAVWAWGAGRVVDYLVTLPEIDVDRIIVTGHSRTGKAALLAGVLDERFAMVVPNGSGCGGAGAYRYAKKGVETLKLITLESRFKSWLQKDFSQFSDKESHLPFDQHFMRALIAPRLILNTDGLADEWANPPGTQIAWMAAQPVFEFLGVPQNNLCHFRKGGHNQAPLDYQVLLDVADWYFKGKPLTRDFSALPDPAYKPTWSWKAPAPVR